ncbi:MAG: hypothetical protein R2813_07980 [Flavobacteriales bacterium]
MKSYLLAIAIIFLSLGEINSQEISTEIVPIAFKMKGRVSSKGGVVKSGVVRVFKYNEQVEVAKIKRSGKFSVRLQSNARYMLDFTMEDHVSKKVFVNTKVDDGAFWDRVFKFDVMLYADKMVQGIDEDFFDYPVAIIEYDHEVEKLGAVDAYTDDIQRELKAMYVQKMQAAQSESAPGK